MLQQDQEIKPVPKTKPVAQKPVDATPDKPKQATEPVKVKVDSSAIHKISLKINQQHEKPETSAAEGTKEPAGTTSDSYSVGQFTAAWNKLAASYKNDSLALSLAMTSHKPVINETGTVIIKIDNVIQADLIREKKAEILGALRHTLRNYQINIETRVVTKKKEEKAYLPTEKLQKLIKKNPAVEKLQKILGLDLEY